jgi:hypothetical protein
MKYVPIEQFTYDKVTKQFVTEASTIGLIVGETLKQFIIIGRTGTKVLYELAHIDTILLGMTIQ